MVYIFSHIGSIARVKNIFCHKETAHQDEESQIDQNNPALTPIALFIQFLIN